MSLQKILFFCHAWVLIRLKKPLVRHSFEAWQHGPVLPYLYRDFKVYGDRPITGRAKSLDIGTGLAVEAKGEFDAKTAEVIESISDFYARLPAGELVRLTHVEGGPWHKVWHHQGRINPGMKISNESIERFYSALGDTLTVQ